MKKLGILVGLLALTLLLNCTPDETIEEQVYLQKKINSEYLGTGDEGDDTTDDKRE